MRKDANTGITSGIWYRIQVLTGQ